MISIRHAALAVLLAGTIGSGVAFAQTPAAKPTDTKTTTQPMAPAKDTKSDTSKSDTGKSESSTTAVKDWTTKQWNAMTKEWAKDKAKWTDCRKQSTAQKLSGRKSWSFLYECMKKA